MERMAIDPSNSTLSEAMRNKTDSSTLFAVLHKLISRLIRFGQLTVIDATGGRHSFGDPQSPCVCIHLHDTSTYWKLLVNPSLYLGEVYMDGDLTLEEGSLLDFLELVFKNVAMQGPETGWIRAMDKIDFLLRRAQQINTTTKSRENVSHHYDLSSSFYELFLDPERQYSCAYFASDADTLEQAQLHKMRHILNKLLVEPHHHILDIGCGWGGLARFMARQTGARVTGITLSEEQLSYAKKKTHEEGLSDRVTFQLCDYRSLSGQYDRIVSVGMFEHVGVNHYEEFFQTVRRLLKPEGVALLHSIGRFSGPSSTNPWIRKYIFPGGYIPSFSEVMPHIENSGLFLTDLEILRLHYAKTLNEWSRRFAEHREQALKLYDVRFCRMWEFYLACSEASFKYLGEMVFQAQLSKSLEAVPLTRNYMTPAMTPPKDPFCLKE